MSDYALGHTDDEARRLIRQAQYLAPHTRRMLEAAGVKAGARVLDLGAGMGDVSMIAAELGAQVVAVERDPATVERARVRVAGRSIEYVQGVLPDIAVDGTFDVICGRLILMYLKDPAASLRAMVERFLAPSGGVAFVEYDFRSRTLPGPALGKQAMATMCKIFEALGCATDLGLRLPQVIAAAGLPTPALDVIMWTGAREDDVGYEMLPGVLRALTPLAERVGLAGEIDPDLATLADRLRAATRDEGTFVGPIVCGAASRR